MERFTILNRPTLQQNTFVFYISKTNDPVRIISILKIPPWPNLMYRSSQTFNIQTGSLGKEEKQLTRPKSLRHK